MLGGLNLVVVYNILCSILTLEADVTEAANRCSHP